MVKNKNELKIGVLLNYLTILLTGIVGILLTPFIISNLGDSEYGLYALMGALIGYLTVLDFGLNNTIIRYISKYRVEGNKAKEEEFLGSIFLIYFFISLTIIAIGSIFYINIESIFSKSLNPSELEKAKIMFLILIFNLSLTLPGGAFTAISIGYEKFIFPKLSNIIKYIIRAISLIVILINGADAVDIVILDTIMNISLILVNAFFVLKVLKVKIKFNKLNKTIYKDIFTYSTWIFISIIAQQFQWNIANLTLGIFTDTKTVAIYAICLILVGLYGAFGSSISSLLLPKATKLVYTGSTNLILTKEMINISKINTTILLFIFGNFLLFGKEFIMLWVGENYINSWLPAIMMMGVMTLSFSQIFGYSIIEAKKKIKFRAISNLILLIIGVIVGTVLIKDYSIIGMVLGVSASIFIFQVFMSIYYHKIIGLNMYDFYKSFFKNIFIFSLLFFFILLIDYNTQITWLNLISKVSLFTIAYLIVVYILILNINEKELVKKMLIKLKTRIR